MNPNPIHHIIILNNFCYRMTAAQNLFPSEILLVDKCKIQKSHHPGTWNGSLHTHYKTSPILHKPQAQQTWRLEGTGPSQLF